MLLWITLLSLEMIVPAMEFVLWRRAIVHATLCGGEKTVPSENKLVSFVFIIVYIHFDFNVYISIVASPQDPPASITAGMKNRPSKSILMNLIGTKFVTGTRIKNLDGRENDPSLWDAESVSVSILLVNASYPNLEMTILYTNVSSNFGPIAVNCSLVGVLNVNCSLGRIPVSY